jgi:mannose-6-phosphate isomerase-like protein (cupin superfamily)
MTTTEKRPWGWFKTLFEAPGWKVKILYVLPGKRLSLQYHKWRQEHWVVVEGFVTATVNDQRAKLGVGDSIDVALGAIHRIENWETIPAIIVETQLGERCDEDDIVRIEDDHGRV